MIMRVWVIVVYCLLACLLFVFTFCRLARPGGTVDVHAKKIISPQSTRNVCMFACYNIIVEETATERAQHVRAHQLSKAPKGNGIGATGSKNWVCF